MRCKNIELSFVIPVPINEPDGNGNIYSEEAIKSSCEAARNIPIIQYNDKGESVVIGVVNNMQYYTGCIMANGAIWYGGTEESVIFDDNNKIISMEIGSLGLCE